MNDAKLRQLMQDDLEMEAKQIMDEVNSDPSLADVEVPQELHDKLFQQIREYEEKKAKAKPKGKACEDDKELIHLGRLYKKNRKINRLIVLAAALTTVLAVSMTSFGGPIKMVETVKKMVLNREQTNILSEDDDVGNIEVASEEEAYQLINDTFSYAPARLYYLPEGMEFSESSIEEATQNARIYYEKGDEKVVVYRMFFDYRTASIGTDTEDETIQQYTMKVQEHTINVQQYAVEDDHKSRWRVDFEYEDVQCFIGIDGLSQGEVEEIIKNIYFSK